MAEVVLAMRRGVAGFSKLVVIKQLRAELSHHEGGEGYRALLLDEAKLAARLSHPNIVQTFEVGEQDGLPYLTMEFLDGQALHRVLNAAQRAYVELPVGLVLRLVSDVLAGLDYAHRLCDYDGTPLGIVHRDVSPHNVFWTYQGEIKLVDFGVAKYLHSSTETEAGVIKGKLTYMAPEQATRASLDHRADLFSAGILLWECLANRPLMPRNNPAAALKKLLYDELPSLTEVRPDLDPAIAAICARALERDPDRRYQRAGEMRAAIEAVLGMGGPSRDDFARFVQGLFENERAEVAQKVKDAMAGESIVDLAGSALSSSYSVQLAAVTRSASASMFAARSSAVLATPRAAAPTAPPPMGSPLISQLPAMSQLPPLSPLPMMSPHSPPTRRSPRLIAASATAALVATAIALVASGAFSGSAKRPPPTAATAAAGAAVATARDAAAPSATTGDVALRLCGSDTIGAELAPALIESFLERKGGTGIRRVAGAAAEHRVVTASLGGKLVSIDLEARGSTTAFEGLAAGTCDLGMSSRAIDEQEAAKLAAAGLGDLRSPASEHVLALDGVAVIVHPDNPLRGLDRRALRRVFTGEISDWSELGSGAGPIRVLARDSKSGTFETFKQLVLGEEALSARAERFAHSDALADAVASDPAAIGFIGLAYVRSARALAVGEPGAPPMLPTSFTVATESYMLSRRLYFYASPKRRSPLMAELIAHALSPRGQAVVAGAQFVDLRLTLRDVEPCDVRCPRAYAAAIAGAQRVSMDFRFRSGSDQADSRAVRDLDRLVTLLHEHPGARLSLFGFSDSVGSVKGNTRLSLERARAIARELATRGVRAQVVAGHGAAMPVASNDTQLGRERNRRVEVWLER
jgi:phosphate transport system substrate-binding protein